MDNVLYSRTSSAEENALVPPLVEALAKESVTDLDLLSVSFPNSETVSKFCVKYSLNDAQQRILSESVEVGQGCCGALVEAAVARARVRQGILLYLLLLPLKLSLLSKIQPNPDA